MPYKKKLADDRWNCKLSFSIKNIPFIIKNSLQEIFSEGRIFISLMCVFVIIAFSFIACSRGRFFPPQPFTKAAPYFFSLFWLMFVIFRYYFSPYFWPFWLKLLASFLYATIFGAWVIIFYSIPFAEVFLAMFPVAMSVLVVLIAPQRM